MSTNADQTSTDVATDARAVATVEQREQEGAHGSSSSSAEYQARSSPKYARRWAKPGRARLMR